jgi:hypothetical protein
MIEYFYNANGDIETNVFPGGFPIVYVDDHGDCVCPNCAINFETIIEIAIWTKTDAYNCKWCGNVVRRIKKISDVGFLDVEHRPSKSELEEYFRDNGSADGDE